MCLQLPLILLKYVCQNYGLLDSYIIIYAYIQKGGPLRDVISSGIEKEYHWWSGYDLLRRLLFFVVYLFCENFANDYTQVYNCNYK